VGSRALAVQRGEGTDRAVRAPDVTQVIDTEQQSKIPAAPEFVQLDQPIAQDGCFRRARLFEQLTMPDGVGQFLFEILGFRFVLREAFRGHGAIDLETPEFGQQRTLAREQAVGFLFECLQALRGAFGCSLRGRRRGLSWRRLARGYARHIQCSAEERGGCRSDAQVFHGADAHPRAEH